jgi:NitT/TauT family transport system substrate-binding protein
MIRKSFAWAAAFGLALSIAGAAAAQTKASLRLDWIPTAAHAFVYLAKERGYYLAEGIDLEIVPGQGSPLAVKLVGNGDNDFGLAEGPAIARGWEAGVPVTSVHLLFSETAAVLFASKTSGITKLGDVCGRKFGVIIQSATYQQVKGMLKAAGVTCSVEEIPLSAGGTREFMSGAVDTMHTYSYNEPVFKLQGFDVVHFDVKDYFKLYSQAIIASDKAMKQGDLAQRFVRASLKGLEDNLKDPKEALAALGRGVKDINLEHEAAKMPFVLDMMTVPGEGGRKIPQQTLAGWNETIDNLVKLGTIKKKVDPAGRFVVATQ